MPKSPTSPLTVRTSLNSPVQSPAGSPVGARTPPATPRAAEDTFEEITEAAAGGSQPATPRTPSAVLAPPAGDTAPALRPLAPQTPEVAALTKSLAAETAQIRTTLGWGAHGIAKGLIMGTLIGAGLGLFSALCANPHAGIAFVVLGVALGFIVGAVAQYKAYGRVTTEVRKALKGSIARLEAAEKGAIPSVELQDARKLLGRLEAGWMGGIGAALTGKGTQAMQKLRALGPTAVAPAAPPADPSEETVEAPRPSLSRSGSNVSTASGRSLIDEDDDSLIDMSGSSKMESMPLTEKI
jgi:F0F1-type ATP synthase assembly protein I